MRCFLTCLAFLMAVPLGASSLSLEATTPEPAWQRVEQAGVLILASDEEKRELEDPFFSELLEEATAAGNKSHRRGPSVLVRMITTTQGPLWPPSNMADENGDFILANGVVLRQLDSGQVIPTIGSAIVSKDTVPPLNASGREDFRNPFGAPYTIVRELDLSPGSPDLDLVVYTQSYGPPEGNFGGGPRVPMEGLSAYNLNSFPLSGGFPCPEVFPTESQRFTYKRPSYPVHRSPTLGFQGDGVAFDIDTGDPYVPRTKVGPDCPPNGCEGEDDLDYFRDEPITLGEWMRTDAWLLIQLRDWNSEVDAYTAAEFTMFARNLIPNRVHQIMAVRQNVLSPRPIYKRPDPLALPQILVSDKRGRGRWSGIAPNPFPHPDEDPEGFRVLGASLGTRADHMTWGGCTMRFAPGVDSMAGATSFAHGFDNLLPSSIPWLVTRPAP